MLEFYLTADFKLESNWSNQISCHFKNQITTYVYSKNGSEVVDSSGLTDRSDFRDQSIPFASCDEVSAHLDELAQISTQKFAPTTSRNFIDLESVTLVLSQNFCRLLHNETQDLLRTYESEGRKASELLCIDDNLIDKKNPSKIRQFILQNKSPITQNILLVGSDIPTFELFSIRDGITIYGHSDLPYGSSESFWASGISKSSPDLKEKIYRSQNFLYRMDFPTFYAFDIRQLESVLLSRDHDYRQEFGVSRWIEEQNIEDDFRHFVEARKLYSPVNSHNILYAQGGEGVMFRPGESQFSELAKKLKNNFKENFDLQASQVLMETSLDQLTESLDQRTSLLALSDHGNGYSVGNLGADKVASLHWLPSVVDLETCFGGAWMLQDKPGDSLISRILNIKKPPVAVAATPALKFSSELYEDEVLKTPALFLHWKKGESLFRRQRLNLAQSIRILFQEIPSYMKKSRVDFLNQMLSSHSVFGDGSVEK